MSQRHDAKGTKSSRKIGRIPICWDPDHQKAVQKAHEQFRWFAGGFAVNAGPLLATLRAL